MKKHPLPSFTPEQQAEQLTQFNLVFPGFAKVRAAVKSCGATADEAVKAHAMLASKLNPADKL